MNSPAPSPASFDADLSIPLSDPWMPVHTTACLSNFSYNSANYLKWGA